MERQQPSVFLSYAKEDLPTARRIHRELETRGLAVWFDKRDLGAGKWRSEISTAIARSRFFLVCLSKAALKKIDEGRGFQDEELSEAYQIALNQSARDFTIVPLRLEECRHGDHRVAMFNQFDVFKDWVSVLDRVAGLMGGHPLEGPSRDVDSQIAQEADEHFATGVSLIITGDFDRALKELGIVLQLRPKHADALAQRAVVHQLLGEYTKALADYDDSLWLQPYSHSTRFNLAVLRFTLGEYSDSLKEIDRALELYPTGAQYHLGRAAVLAKLDRCADAEEECHQAIVYSSDPVSVILQAYNYLHDCSLDKALALLDRGILEHPDNLRLWYQKLKHPTVMADPKQALLVTEKLVELEPEVSYLWSLHADMLRNDVEGGLKIEEALSAQDNAIRLADDPAEEYWRKGNLLCWFAAIKTDESLDLYKLALGAYERGLSCDVSDSMMGKLLHNRAIVLSKLGRKVEALEAAKEAEEQGHPVDPDRAWIEQGRVLL